MSNKKPSGLADSLQCAWLQIPKDTSITVVVVLCVLNEGLANNSKHPGKETRNLSKALNKKKKRLESLLPQHGFSRVRGQTFICAEKEQSVLPTTEKMKRTRKK